MEINGQQETEKIKVSLANEGTVNKNSVVIQTGKGSIKLFFHTVSKSRYHIYKRTGNCYRAYATRNRRDFTCNIFNTGIYSNHNLSV